MIGSKLGSYEVLAKLGEGGMGEVYRARDTRLKREVALKILPQSFATDPERLARFQREAEVLAALNHPNVAAIYGVEEDSSESGQHVRALVMELVEGETLAERIARGPVPLDETLVIARQIADALETAHEQGIIHRDLKPANIKVRPDGTVKVLDFGLAKLVEPAATSASASASLSPTITSPAMVSGVGVLLGTAAYMSPEQAKGKPADKRSDVWAFGCVLYEMLTGRRTFDGADVSDVLAAVLRSEPDWTALPDSVTPSLRTLLRRCLERDRMRRVSDFSTVRFVLDQPAETSITGSAASSNRARVVTMLAMLLAGVAVGGLLFLLWFRTAVPAPPPPVARFSVALPNTQHWSSSPSHLIAISPDGTAVAYMADEHLYVRTLADIEPRLVPGTGAVVDTPFFSPDGRWVAFYVPSERKLKKVALTGGPPLNICDADLVYGATWSVDDWIYFGQAQRGLLRVAAAGGSPEVVVPRTAGEILHGPQVLPGGDVLLFTLASARSGVGWDRARIVTQSLKTGQRTVIREGGSDARYVRSGHVLYAVGGTVLAIPFDVNGMRVTGAAVPILEGVARSTPGRVGTGAAQFAVSDTGTLAYILAANATTDLTVALVDRAGRRRLLNLPAGAYGNVRFSPSGKQLAMQIDDGRESAVWIYDLAGGTAARRLTFDGRNTRPTWTPDGQRLTFRSERGPAGEQAVAWQAADGSGPAERIGVAESGTTLQPEAWTPDGRTLLLSVSTVGGGERSLATLLPGRDARPTPLVPTYATNASLSPDGRWFAYYSDLGDHNAIFVQPYPSTGAKYVLPGDGRDPVWSPDAKQLFFVRNTGSRAELMSVPVYTTGGVSFGEPEKLGIDGVNSIGPRSYDVAPDGRSFAAVFTKLTTSDAERNDRFQIILNWLEEVKQRVPTR